MRAYAHSLKGQPLEKWQPLEDHLLNVSRVASEFARPFGASDWAKTAGAWHDLGKYSPEFQNYLLRKNGFEAHIEDVPGRVDHSTAGAKHAVTEFKALGHLIAYCIAGHHSGLLNGIAAGACQDERLKKRIPAYPAPPDAITRRPLPDPPAYVKRALGDREAFSIAFFTRMMFSCLVDADFLDTESNLQPDKALLRGGLPDDVLERMERSLNQFVVGISNVESSVNVERDLVRQACLRGSALAPGFFSLTVPTGGGKTLASLAFALRHAIAHKLERVIYVVPFTSIIEQNADVFRAALIHVADVKPDRIVIEHHSNFEAEKETPESRVACENWDAPLVVTTSVQFYESLFANRSSPCRKLHNLAQSVIVLDEAQTIPVQYLQPCLAALKELAANYGSTVVLCTATQPAVHRRENFTIGIEGVREIIPDPAAVYKRLKRVEVKAVGARTDDELADEIRGEDQVLCIVNTRGHAAALVKALGEDEGHFHLSAMMCPAHRTKTLDVVRVRLTRGERCRVISTQLIEAGVDVDFPVVFRSMAGLDSIAQAAGRCNRNGRLARPGRVVVFKSEHEKTERFISDTANAGAQVLEMYTDDPLALEAIERYFKLYYWDQTSRWDEKGIMSQFNMDGRNHSLPFLFNFATVAREFRLIDDNTRPVFIPWGAGGESLREDLRKLPCLNREIARRLQRYTVQLRAKTWYEQLNKTIEPICDGSLALLISPQFNYSDTYGLHFGVPAAESLVH